MVDKREVICGMMGDIHWKPLLLASGLEGLEVKGNWTRTGDTLIGEGTGSVGFGEDDWANYELSMCVRAIEGGNVQVVFRSSAEGNYMVDMLLGWKAVSVTKADRRPGGRGFHKFSVVNYDLENHREYELQIALRGASITTYLDGQLVNQVSDYDFPKGRAALCVWQGKTEFRNIRYRLLQ